MVDTLTFFIIFAGFFVICCSFSLIDKKYGLKFEDWFNGIADSPFPNQHNHNENVSTSAQNIRSEKDEEIDALKDRIATLEKIVTDRSYELNEKLRELK